MKKIKDMTQLEVEKVIAGVVHHYTDRYDSIMKEIMERFGVIEEKINHEISFPNTAKESLMRDIKVLVGRLSKIYDLKEIK